MDLDHADHVVARNERHPHARASAEPAGDVLVHFGIVEDRVDSLTAPALEHGPALRARTGERLPEHGRLARDGGEPQLVCAARQRKRHDTGADELAQVADDECEEALEIGLGRQAFPTSFNDWSWFDHRVAAS